VATRVSLYGYQHELGIGKSPAGIFFSVGFSGRSDPFIFSGFLLTDMHQQSHDHDDFGDSCGELSNYGYRSRRGRDAKHGLLTHREYHPAI
jgi:hypothetical protein